MLIMVIISVQVKSQSKLHSPIEAHYISFNLVDQKDSTKQYWDPIHKNPSHRFKCHWLKNRDVKLDYGTGKPVIFKRINNFDKNYMDQLPKSIRGFILEGIYSTVEQLYVFYINPKKKNSILIQAHIFGESSHKVFSSVYFTDDPSLSNPFKGVNTLKISNEIVRSKLNMKN